MTQPLFRTGLIFVFSALCFLNSGGILSAAIEKDFKMDLGFETSTFPQSGKGAQEDHVATLQAKPDLALYLSPSFQTILSPRFRLGLTDPEFHLVSLDDVYLEYLSEQIEVRAGYQTNFWGTVESFNLVDILNQRDYVGDFLDPGKLGEPTFRLRISFENDRVDLFYFPYFTPAPLPGPVNRFHFFDGTIDLSDDPLYTSLIESRRPQFAFRWERTLGPADLGLTYFNGYEKFPIIYLEPGPVEAQVLYYEMQQAGIDLQMNLGNWLLKAEGIVQDTAAGGSFNRNIFLPSGGVGLENLIPDDHTAGVGGVEYTFVNLIAKTDLGVLLEFLVDSEQDPGSVAFRPFQNDLFGGFRWVRNNPGDGEVLAGIFHDIRLGSQIWRVEYSERYFDLFRIEGTIDLFNADKKDPLATFNNDDRLMLKVTYTY